MVWALDLDDFNNQCGGGNYPLLKVWSPGRSLAGRSLSGRSILWAEVVSGPKYISGPKYSPG